MRLLRQRKKLLDPLGQVYLAHDEYDFYQMLEEIFYLTSLIIIVDIALNKTNPTIQTAVIGFI